ncbi:MAG: class I SAM-dependent methyltransferase [Rhodothermaceae bacterium]|nr:class I SAM-dependent methyltransferase [Rhodothermaceae bacterium]
MIKLFNELLIKYADHRLLFVPVTIFLIISLPLWFFAGSVVTPILLGFLLLIVITVQIHLYRKTCIDMDHQQRNIQALVDLHTRIDFRLPLPSLDNWTASPELITRIFYLMKLHQPGVIVELGSGASSVCGGYFCEHLGGGKLITLDHDNNYAGLTRKNLNNHSLDSYVDVRHAPLMECDVNGSTHTWYDLKAFDDIHTIDMLIIDGPPHKTQLHARFPALPLLFSKLSKHAVIILDDASREQETEIVRRWITQYPEFETEFIPSDKGLCILTRKPEA